MNVRILPYGRTALLVQWPQRIDPVVHQRVLALARFLCREQEAGMVECVPAYCSLLVTFDPLLTSADDLRKRISAFSFGRDDSTPARRLRIPVCYHADYAPDLTSVAARLALSTAQLIDLHTQAYYTVYMLGFLPGFPYLGSLPPALHTERHHQPRTRVAAGSVGLAGAQTGIYPLDSPGGWQIIGRTPVATFQPTQPDAFLLRVGDQVQFVAISSDDFARWTEHPTTIEDLIVAP